MRYLSQFLAMALIINSLAAVPAALAMPVSFTQAGEGQTSAVECHLPVNSIGPVLLNKGSARLAGGNIDVATVPEWLFDPQIVLSGVVINSQIETSGPKSMITGLAYFNKGDWLNNLGSTVAKDTLYLNSGDVVTVQVGATADNALEVLQSDGTRRKIPFADIRDIRSPRAYRFSIPASSVKLPLQPGGSIDLDGSRLTFAASGSLRGRLAQKPSAPVSHLPGTEGAVSNRAIAGWLALDVANDLAPAITAPIMYSAPFKRQRQLLKQFGNFSITGNPFSGVPTQSQLDAIFHP